MTPQKRSVTDVLSSGLKAALAAEGLTIVPIRPTASMSCRGDAEIMAELAKFPILHKNEEIQTPADRCWAAMLESAPK